MAKNRKSKPGGEPFVKRRQPQGESNHLNVCRFVKLITNSRTIKLTAIDVSSAEIRKNRYIQHYMNHDISSANLGIQSRNQYTAPSAVPRVMKTVVQILQVLFMFLRRLDHPGRQSSPTEVYLT